MNDIKQLFLHYKTLAGFQAALNNLGEESLYDKIVFIKQEKLIWTHGTYYQNTNGEGGQDIVLLEQNLENEITRATNKENSLQDQIDEIANSTPTGGDSIKHVFLTQEEYDSLEEYEENTIYFILEPINEAWTFGGTFPVTLS